MAEAFRALEVGGQAVFAEPEWRTLVIDHRDPFLSDTFTRYVVEHQVRNLRLGSQLARLCHETGFFIESVVPALFDDAATADHILGLGRVAQRAKDAGRMTEKEHRRWIG